MTKFYKNPGFKHLEMTPLIKTCMLTLKEIEDNPTLVLTMDHDVFNNQLEVDDVLLKTTPTLVLTMDHDMFNNQLEVDDVLLKLRSNSKETSQWFNFTISLLAK